MADDAGRMSEVQPGDILAGKYRVERVLGEGGMGIVVAATHLALAAESLGLNSAFMNGWQEDAVKEVIGAKDNPDIAIALLMPVGYGDGSYGHAGRLPQTETVFQNTLP